MGLKYSTSYKLISIVRLATVASVLVANAQSAFAFIPESIRRIDPTSSEDAFLWQRPRDFSKGFDLGSIHPVESLAVTRSEDVSRYIPNNMAPTNDSSTVANQILDRSLSTIFNSDIVRASSIGRTAHQVEKSMESDIKFGSAQPNSVQHSLKFSMRATQTRADVEYTGLTTAQVTYFILQDKTNLEIREPVSLLKTKVVYNNIIARDDRRQTVSLRWDW